MVGSGDPDNAIPSQMCRRNSVSYLQEKPPTPTLQLSTSLLIVALQDDSRHGGALGYIGKMYAGLVTVLLPERWAAQPNISACGVQRKPGNVPRSGA